jgi:predicted AlkP superfamily pyrophosphatase or phosphodiesterase
MYMEKSGNFASSTYYMAQHPAWATSFNAKKPADRYYGKTWAPLLDAAAYAGDANEDLVPLKKDVQARFPFSYYSESGKPDADYYKRLKTSPALDELTLEFAQAAVEGENLGRNPAGVTDVLGVSMSAHDYVNHTYGPESKMSHDHLQRLDRMLAKFFGFLDQRVGLDNVVVVLTADHGFANVPEFSQTRHLDSDRLDGDKLAADLDQHLASTLGVAKLVKKPSIPNFYLDYDAAAKANIGRAALEDAAARFVLQQPGVADVFTRTQMENGVVATRTAKLMRRGWNRQMSGDLMVVAKPFWIFSTEKTGTTHGSPYAYDTNVPLILMGKRWIKPGSYGQYAEVVDIVPTLGHLLRVRPPAAAEGRVLTETLR